MTLQRIYHPIRHCYIIADVTDAGAKTHVTPATGDEQLQREQLPKPPAPIPASVVRVTNALRDGPATVGQVAAKTGMRRPTVQDAMRRGGFAQVGTIASESGHISIVW